MEPLDRAIAKCLIAGKLLKNQPSSTARQWVFDQARQNVLRLESHDAWVPLDSPQGRFATTLRTLIERRSPASDRSLDQVQSSGMAIIPSSQTQQMSKLELENVKMGLQRIDNFVDSLSNAGVAVADQEHGALIDAFLDYLIEEAGMPTVIEILRQDTPTPVDLATERGNVRHRPQRLGLERVPRLVLSLFAVLFITVVLVIWLSSRPSVQTADYEVEVLADQYWYDTGIQVNPGDIVELQATGSWWDGVSQAGPDGDPGRGPKDCGGCIMSDANPLELIGRIGLNNRPFRIGSLLKREVNESGILFLSANDNEGPCQNGETGSCFRDNRGTVVVKVTLRKFK
jgi:hypothetical protein